MGRARQGVLRLSSARILWIPVAAAALIQALLFFTFEPEVVFDSASYMAQAESLAATGSARNALGEPDTVRTPGYPLFLATSLALGAGYPGAILAQRILWILLVAGTSWVAFALTRRTIVAVVAGAITAIDLPALQAVNGIVTETLAAVFVALAAWFSYRSAANDDLRSAILSGLMAGIAAMIRPVAILLGLPLALAIVIAPARRRGMRIAAAVIVASLVVPAAWVGRNYAQTGVATFSSISGINLLLFRAAGTLAMRDPGGVDANLQRRQQELEAFACRAAVAQFGRPCELIPITQRATLYPSLAMPILLADPVGVVMQAGRALVMIMFGGGAAMLSGMLGIGESTARVIALLYTVPLAVLAWLGVAYWRRVDPAAAWVMLLTIAYLVVMSLGVEAYSRFRVPFVPLYAMLAGGGAAALANRWTPTPMK